MVGGTFNGTDSSKISRIIRLIHPIRTCRADALRIILFKESKWLKNLLTTYPKAIILCLKMTPIVLKVNIFRERAGHFLPRLALSALCLAIDSMTSRIIFSYMEMLGNASCKARFH